MKQNVAKIVENLLRLQQAYAFTYRAIITEERYKGLIESKLVKDFTYDSEFVREPLLEHVGHLPIIASYLHPYIEHRDEVNLGRSLIMLSVHDIGETEVGDVLTFAKGKAQIDLERNATRRLLPNYLYKYFEEIEERKSFDAMFAKSVDSIAPILHEMVLPEVTIQRFKYHKFDIEKIILKKQKHFEWDGVLIKIFECLIDRYKQYDIR